MIQIISAIFAYNMGILYVVPTPVGNLEDMTFRAIRILKEADFVLAEDTRTSGMLLKHYEIQNHLMSHHKFNEHGTAAGVVERLKGGATVALVSDAGTPGISDPGFYLVREAVAAGIEVQVLPGATAFVPALVASGSSVFWISPLIPCADGMICTYAFANSVATIFHLPLIEPTLHRNRFRFQTSLCCFRYAAPHHSICVIENLVCLCLLHRH